MFCTRCMFVHVFFILIYISNIRFKCLITPASQLTLCQLQPLRFLGYFIPFVLRCTRFVYIAREAEPLMYTVVLKNAL